MSIVPSGDSTLELSAEFFPPKSEKGRVSTVAAAADMKPLGLSFCSVTYGAGGTNQTGTQDTALAVAHAAGSEPAGHLTAVGASRSDVDAVADGFWRSGIRRIVALRGDPQGNASRYEAHPDGYQNAADLVAGLRRLHDFDISVAAYPEKHPESATVDADIDNLKAKFAAGADRGITQFFFDPEAFLRFRDRAAARGVWQPIVPGILPIRNIEQVVGFAERCGAAVPGHVVAAFDACTSAADRKQVAIDLAHRMCERLLRHGVREFHFYTLNKADLTEAVCARLMNSADTDKSAATRAAFAAN
ncbi:methylenetetrahydrofolate reductase [Minwuia sp.]|uniref:methylenetetrahydrofolate reductase n=1 Tax=Minwuia sp. TaxID=2493630 RepID=UPI003A92200F